MKIIDTHTHLNDDKLYSELDLIIQRAKEAGVEYIFNNADSLDSFERIEEISSKYNNCFSVLGIHPEFADESDEYFYNAYKYIKDNKDHIKAIGEIGLDYHYSKDENYINKQKQRFIEQIRLAKELNLPIVIHSRDAAFDTYNIIKEEKPPKIDLHCYSSSWDIAELYLKLNIDFNIGVGGVITFSNSRVLQEVVSNIHIDNILTETDAPYLAPAPYRGSRNEPSYLPLIIKRIAEIKGLDISSCADILYKNGLRFYGLKGN